MNAANLYQLPDFQISPEHRIWIYGTGEIAKSFFEQISSLFHPERVKGFINSFGYPSTFMGKKVIAVTDLRVAPNDRYLVASQGSANIMLEMLLRQGAQREQIICRPDWLSSPRKDRRPILIYQFGKVASTSIYESIKRLNLEVYHSHFLQPKRLTISVQMWKDAGEEIPSAMGTSLYLMKEVHNRNWDVISLVRDPVARNISAFFQILKLYAYSFKNDTQYMQMDLDQKVDVLIREFFRKFNHEDIFSWFDEEMKATFGIDVFERPFDQSIGYRVYERDGNRLLVLQFERLSGLVDVIRNFLGLPEFELSRENVGETKDYAPLYKRFRERIRFDDAFLDRMYNNPFVRHFYSEEDIEAFRRKWSKQP